MTSWFLISPGAPKWIWSSFTTPNSQKSWSHAGKKPSICFKTIYLSGKRQWCFINLTCPKKHHMISPFPSFPQIQPAPFLGRNYVVKRVLASPHPTWVADGAVFVWISKRLGAWSKVREDTGEEGAWSGGKFRLESFYCWMFFLRRFLCYILRLSNARKICVP